MTSAVQPGRHCPLHYRYAPAVLKRNADFHAETLYVIGGLYGNRPALRAIEALAAAEPGPVKLAFNGDFNWFNIDPAAFREINEAVLAHPATRGNVETEIASDDDSAGCGCAYPESVDDEDVIRSNAILAQLRDTTRAHASLRTQLAQLPMHLVAEVGGLRIAIVHGDCESLAGWSYDESAMRRPEGAALAAAHCEAGGVRIVASSHTCLPVAWRFSARHGDCALFNNGAAGMPNFAGTRFGIITRIAATPAQSGALYGTMIDGVSIDALPVHYDQQQWRAEFDAQWPAGSEAEQSYGRRITNGPRYGMNRAMGAGIRVNPVLFQQLQFAGNNNE